MKFGWEITQFVSSTSMLAVKSIFDPSEPKMSKKFSIVFQLKNKRNDNEKWAETQIVFRPNEVAKIVEFLNMREPVEKSTYYYRLDDEADRKSLIRLLGGGKLVESIVTDGRNFPVALVLQHRYKNGDSYKGKVIALFKGVETKNDKYRGAVKGEFVKLLVKTDDGVFLKKIGDIETENFKLQLEAVVQMTTIIPVIYKLDKMNEGKNKGEKDETA